MKNDTTRTTIDTIPDIYDKVTIRLHWATAALVSILWLMGRTIGFMPRGPSRIDMWSLHILLGAILACVLVARIIWRATNGRKLPSADRSALERLARAVHWLLYLLLAIVVVLGVINVFTHAFPLFNIWRFPKIGGGDLRMKINNWHDLAANIIMVLALLHATAALLHHLVIKDTVLRRMWPSRQQARQGR
ncbi:cytochrome b561 [Nitrobacteraceae bacterium AZCC 1564]